MSRASRTVRLWCADCTSDTEFEPVDDSGFTVAELLCLDCGSGVLLGLLALLPGRHSDDAALFEPTRPEIDAPSPSSTSAPATSTPATIAQSA